MSSIIHAASFSSPYGGNFVASLRALERVCKQAGWTLVLALPVAAAKRDWCARLIAEGWQVRFLPNDASVLRYAGSLCELAAATNTVLIHTHFSLYDVPAWAASCLLRLQRRRISVVWHAHSDFPTRMTPIRWVKDLLKYRVMGRTIRIIAVSEHLHRQIVDSGENAAAIETVHNGIDLVRAVTATRSKVEVFEEHHIPRGNHLLLLFGWEPNVKGVDIAMAACERLVTRGLPIVLGVVGTAALRAFLSKRTGATPPAWLRVLPPTENVANLYQASTIFISASRCEGFPYSIGEAMANRLPVVLSDLPGVSWARKTPGALFFPSGDVESLTVALGDVLAWTADKRDHHTAANEHLIRTEFTVSAWADRILRSYQEIAGG